MEGAAVNRWARYTMWLVAAIFVVAMTAFSILRMTAGDAGSVDTNPRFAFDVRYVDHPVVTFAHIIPGAIYLVLGLFQLSRRTRRRSLDRHRAVGRIAVVAALISALFGIVFGVFIPFAGFLEQSASMVFGLYLAAAVVLGLRLARAGDRQGHRRWMIRGFAIGTGVATIRVVLALGEQLDILTFDEHFGVAFWVGFALNALVAELWLSRWPTQPRL